MKAYRYLTLRYMHDGITDEFVNVGVVVYSPGKFLGGRFNSRIQRLNSMFGAIDKAHFKSLVNYLESSFRKLQIESDGELVARGESLSEIVAHILPPDDSCLQWSQEAGGMTENFESDLNELFDRLVCHYEQRAQPHRRDDDAVWRVFNEPLRRKHLLQHLTEKKIESPDYSHEFKHAFKNGQWNLYEPVSLDYEETKSIIEKGSRWLGQGIALRDSEEQHKLWFLIGEPETEKRKRAATKAMNLMGKIGHDRVEIITEKDREAFSVMLEDEVAKHNSGESAG